MKRVAAFFLAVCLMACAVLGSGYPAQTIAIAEPAEAAEQTKEPAEEPTKEPEKESPTPEPQKEEKEEPEPEKETPVPDAEIETPAPDVTEDVSTPTPPEDSGVEETPAPDETEAAEPTETPAPDPKKEEAPKEVIEGDGPVWIATEKGRRYGELKDIILLAEEKDTIYLETKDVIKLAGYTVDALRKVKFAPDPDKFTAKTDAVIVSDLDPMGNAEKNTIFLWVGNPASAPEKTKSPAEQVQLSDEEYAEMEIQAQIAQADGEYPVFTLVCVPELMENQRFAVIINEAEPMALNGNSYNAKAPGELRFAVLDENDAILVKSKKYVVEEIVPADDSQDEPDQTEAPIDDAEEQLIGEEPTGDGSENENKGEEPPVEEIPTEDGLVDETNDTTGGEEPIGDEEGTEETEELMARAMVIEIEIGVSAIDYFPGETSDVAPTFTLSGKPEGDSYRYAVMENGGDPVALSGNTYTAAQAGDYSLRFAILDAVSNIVALSGKYTLSLDFEPPVATKKQAWMEDPNDGSKKLYGTLSGLISQAPSGSTINLLTDEAIALGGGAGLLAGISLKPDPDTFSGQYTVKVSYTQNGLQAQVVDLSGAGGGTEDVELAVTSENYTAGEWANASTGNPVFSLTQIPETATGYGFAVIVNGGTPVRIEDSAFTASEEGQYELVFALLDDLDQIAAQLGPYAVAVDATPPVLLVNVSEEGMLTITVSDAVSETIYISLDGGASWREAAALRSGGIGLEQILSKSYAAGMIQAKDAAGNIAVYDQKITGMGGFGGFGGFGGSGGGDSRTVSHSSSDDDSTTAYNAVDLTTDADEMSVLTLGGETLDLVITRAAADESFEVVGDAAFTVDLAAWNGEEDSAYDTLVLSAITDGADDEYAFLWDFSGSVYKKLSASGIDYLVLRVGERVTAISTAGFTGGARYNLLKANGVASKDFRYHVLMGVPQPDMKLNVDVDGETYSLTDDPASEMYYYDILAGGVDLMNRNFGA